MSSKYEYLVNLWGGFFNDEYRAVHGYENGPYWFDTKEERSEFIDKLKALEKEHGYHHLVFSEEEGYGTRLQTIAKMVLKYRGVYYELESEFQYAYPVESAYYMFFEGNYSCDCNRSLFLSRKYKDFPELDCGHEIEMVNFKVIGREIDGTEHHLEGDK